MRLAPLGAPPSRRPCKVPRRPPRARSGEVATDTTALIQFESAAGSLQLGDSKRGPRPSGGGLGKTSRQRPRSLGFRGGSALVRRDFQRGTAPFAGAWGEPPEKHPLGGWVEHEPWGFVAGRGLVRWGFKRACPEPVEGDSAPFAGAWGTPRKTRSGWVGQAP